MKIPRGDQRLIESVCDSVHFWPGGSLPGAFDPDKRHIRVVVDYLENTSLGHSEAGQRGIFAHEFGHACDYAERGVHPRDERTPITERYANKYVAKWGFADDYRRAEAEHPSKHGIIGLDVDDATLK